MNAFLETITSTDPELRNRSFASLMGPLSTEQRLAACEEIEAFRSQAENLYERVRATLFLYAAYRFHLMEAPDIRATGTIPYQVFEDLLSRRFERAIAGLRDKMKKEGPDSALLSALAEAYHHLAFATLGDQVRRSVRASRGNQWMFRVGHAEDHPLRLRRNLLSRPAGTLLYPILCEKTPVRLDLSHSGWSDIFFLGMDFPEGARVLNISVDLGEYGQGQVKPPIETYVRVIPEAVLRLTSIDLKATKDIADLADLFNFGNDYLSLLKAGVIASGLVPPSFEGTHQSIAQILAAVVGPGMGIEVVSQVNDIPKGSRLAVSTNLLASLIGLLMRATGQTENLVGMLNEPERRLVASRAILGEWLGGSGGGWQDSGGVWPGLKVIEGALAGEGDPEHGVSRGRLLPKHRILGEGDLHPEIHERLAQSLVLLHGGMAQNVGPILEMVTEKYLLRGAQEWQARQDMRGIFAGILESLKEGDIRKLGELTTRNFKEPLQTIIPWATNHFTETIQRRAAEEFGEDYWGFLMLGGMSGGGMAMFVAPTRRAEFLERLSEILRETKREMEDALPFAMDPVLKDFSVNPRGTFAELLPAGESLLPPGYYAIQVPEMVRENPADLSYLRRAELDHFTAQHRPPEETFRLLRSLVGNLFRVSDPATHAERAQWHQESEKIKAENGFDPIQHEQIRRDLRQGLIGLSRNRLPADTVIEDVSEKDVTALSQTGKSRSLGEAALKEGKVAVLSLAGGVGTRWTSGAGVIKAVNPFLALAGKHRSFLEIHLAKSRKASRVYGQEVPHLVSTSYLTDGPIRKHLDLSDRYGYTGPLYLSRGQSIGQRLIPMVRDLAFLWEETPQEMLDVEKQKVREAVRFALMDWARSKGEGGDYEDNLPIQRFHPPGHWYEVPNLLLNGTLAKLLEERPQLETLLLHNIDTLGADLDPAALGHHLKSGNLLTFEVVPRRISDSGGGLARVNGQLRLLEGLAQPREEDELRLRYYNSMTTWIAIDPLLELFGLSRADLSGSREKIAEAVRKLGQRMPTYVTIKEVKRRWGHGQEDVFPVAQFEKLWSDMTSLPKVQCGYLAVPRSRGQQLKDPAELDAWVGDGSRDHLLTLCDFD
jgi:galactokinase/mevalonate kinase-like predicted kinase